MEAVIFTGVQGSGKTTFYKERFFETHVRISRDMIKTRHREQVLLIACLVAKQPFVVDNTNVLLKQRAPFIASSKTVGFRIIGYYFDCDVGDALRRNNARPVGQVIPPAGVLGTFKRLQRPSVAEGFDELWVVQAKLPAPSKFSTTHEGERMASAPEGLCDRQDVQDMWS